MSTLEVNIYLTLNNYNDSLLVHILAISFDKPTFSKCITKYLKQSIESTSKLFQFNDDSGQTRNFPSYVSGR